MIEPPCQAREFQAMARGKRLLGTSMGPMAVEAGPMNARLTPNRAERARSRGMVAKSKIAAAARITAVMISPRWQSSRILRRSYRSAASPAGRASTKTGTKAASPIMPTSKADWATPMVSRATEYICQPRATLWICTPRVAATRAAREQHEVAALEEGADGKIFGGIGLGHWPGT